MSFRFHGNSVSSLRKAKHDLLDAVSAAFQETYRSIQALKIDPRRAQPPFVQGYATVDRLIPGWGDAFKDADQWVEFAQLDKQFDDMVLKFQKWYFASTKAANPKRRMHALGVALPSDARRAETPRQPLGDRLWAALAKVQQHLLRVSVCPER